MTRSSNGEKIVKSLRRGDELKDEKINGYLRESTSVVFGAVKQPNHVIRKTEKNLRIVEGLLERRTNKER